MGRLRAWMKHVAGGAMALLCVTASGATIEGSAAYRERIALPPDSVFEVRVEDTARADAPATVLARQRIEPAGQPPWRFRLEVDDAAFSPRGRHAVRATVTSGGRLLFTTDTVVPVGPGANPPLELRLVAVRSGRPGAAAPASYAGELPSASGPVRWQVDLLPGQRFQLRQTFVARPEPNTFDDIGRWRIDAQGRLELRGGREAPLWFAWAEQGAALRKLDLKGAPIDSAQPDLLRRLPAFAPIEPRLHLTGMVRYLADAASITLCADGRRLPVSMEADWLALERAYTQARLAGAPVLASLEGLIAPRTVGEEGRPPQPALVVERFGRLWPRETCGQPGATSPLRNTYWKLVRLGDAPAPVAPGQREPHLVLHEKDARVAGSSGCNRLIGRYSVDGERLSFSGLAGTRMACEPDAMATERAFLDALARVARWRVQGSHLELLDAAGAVLARFEAVALR